MKDESRSRTLDADLELGSHDLVRSEIVLLLPSLARLLMATPDSATTGVGVTVACAGSSCRESLGGSLSKERVVSKSIPVSKDGISKDRAGGLLSESARA